MREITYVEALVEAQAEEMRRDDTVVIFGEGIGSRGGNWGQTKGLWAEFGEDRCKNTPISELGFTGLAAGAAMCGLRPIVDTLCWDFMWPAMDQIINQLARIHYISGGKIKVPLVIHGSIGMGNSSGAHHSNCMYAALAHYPGLKVVVPATPYDAKGLLKTAIRCDDPVMVFEHKFLYHRIKGPVPEEQYTLPLGVADVKRDGKDVTVVAFARMVFVALEAAELLAQEGVSVEVVDPRCLVPFDTAAILASVRKTHRLVVLDEEYSFCGSSAEVAAMVAEHGLMDLDAPIKRVCTLPVPAPYTTPLEKAILPDVSAVVAAVREVLK
jgi:pyruvate/2-oxoglutarate/acetoin dehydrogenase E1 component